MVVDERILILEGREHRVVKHNDIVQKSRYKLSATEQKTVAFLVSLIKPEKDQSYDYEFEIQDYCKICGIDYNGGKNYRTVRDTLKSLRDKSINVKLPNGTDTCISWINKYWTNKGSGKAKIRFDEDMAPYLLDLKENTTRYELLNILPMQSKFSIRLYELCRSWAGIGIKQYTIKELRDLLQIPENELIRYPDFRRFVLEIAQREINEHTDLIVYFEPVTKGRKTEGIILHIDAKSPRAKQRAHFGVNDILDKKRM